VERVVDTLVVVAIASVAILVLSVRESWRRRCWSGWVTALLVVGVAAGIAAHRPPAPSGGGIHRPVARVRLALVALARLAVASDKRTMGPRCCSRSHPVVHGARVRRGGPGRGRGA
jgi:hypothetical protein